MVGIRPPPACEARSVTPASRLLATLCLICVAGSSQADITIADFLGHAFAATPAPSVLWLTPELKQRAQAAAGFAPDGARLRYWRDGERTAWVLDRVGKEAPITFGVVVERDAIVSMEVITYRESRGQEIRSPRWIAQFAGVHAARDSLDRDIDNITGATLSVRASRDVARLALFLHHDIVAARGAP